MNKKIIFVTGASGSGKTTIISRLSEILPDIHVYHFDDIGVPSHNDMITEFGSSENWQNTTLRKWVQKLSKLFSHVILEGSFYPRYIKSICEEYNVKYRIILFHTDYKTRKERLLSLRSQPELVSQDMENYANMLLNETQLENGLIIDTTTKSIENLTNDVAKTLDDIVSDNI